MTIPVPPPVDPITTGVALFTSALQYMRGRGSDAIYRAVARGSRSVVASVRAQRAPPAPPSPPSPPIGGGPAQLPIPAGPVRRIPAARYVGGGVLGAGLLGYQLGTEIWRAVGTSVLDQVMPGYDPNRPRRYNTGELQARTRRAQEEYARARREAEMALRDLQRHQAAIFARRVAGVSGGGSVASAAPARPDRDMAGLEEIRVTARPVPYPAPVPAPPPSLLARARALYATYQRYLALAIPLFGIFQRGRQAPQPAAPAVDPFTPSEPAAAPVYDVAWNTRDRAMVAPETATRPKRCPPCRKGTQRKRPKRDACRNPVVRRRTQTRDGRRLQTITRELVCQP